MRTVDSELQTAYEKGAGLAIASAVIQPFDLPERINDLGTIDAADDADSGSAYVMRVRKNGALVQINRFLRSGYATVANWNSWTTLYTESATITHIYIFVHTGPGTPRTQIGWKKTGDTNIYGINSADEGATWNGIETTINTANTIDLLQGVHNGGFLYRDATANKLYIQAYRGVIPAWIVNEVPVPDTANVVIQARGSKRTINVNGTNTDIITIALISATDAAINDHKLWIGSATDYLTTTETWTAATVIRGQDETAPDNVFSVFDDYISCTQLMGNLVICKLVDYYGITYGYLGSVANLNYTIIGYNNTGTSLLYKEGAYSGIYGTDLEYTVLEYHCTRDSIQCRVTGTTIPADGLLIVSRGYHVADDDYTEPLTPYRIQSWRTNPDRTFTIQGVTGHMALQGRSLPPGLQINQTRAITLRLCFAAVGISCTPNSEAIINAQPYPIAEPTITTLSAAITRQNNAGSIEIWNTEYGLRAIATQATSSTQTITPDGGLLPHKDYTQAMGLHASFVSAGSNVISGAIEGDGGYPYWPYIANFPYNPADFNEDLIENLHEERQFLGFFGTRANMSLEIGDVVTIVSSLLRIVDIVESFGGNFVQEIRYRWHTEPLSLGDYGITPTQSSSSGVAIAPIQGHEHSTYSLTSHTHAGGGGGDVVGPASAIDDRIATFDGTTGKIIQDGGATIASLGMAEQITAAGDETTLLASDMIGFRKAAGSILKRIAYLDLYTQLESAFLGVFADASDFSIHLHDNTATSKLPQANTHQTPDTDTGTSSLHHTIGTGANQAAAGTKGVTNGDTHDHVGGDGAQINHTGLSNIGTNTHAQIDTHIATGAHVTNGDTHNHVGGDGGALNYTAILPAHGLNGTIAAGATMSTPLYYYGLNTARFNFTVDRAGTLALFSMWTNTAQPATGTLVATVLKNNGASALTVTFAAGAGSSYLQDVTNTVAVVAGDLISIDIKNNASTASAQVNGLTIGFRAATT